MPPRSHASGMSADFVTDHPATLRRTPRGIATVTLAHQPKRFVRKGERCEAEEHQLRSPDGECHAQRRGVERGRP